MIFFTTGEVIYILLLLFLLGTVLCSFICCTLDRRLAGESSKNGRSHCDACGRTLSVPELIPILGYLVSGGKCKACGAKIPARYPICEAAMGLTFALIGYKGLKALDFDLAFAAINWKGNTAWLGSLFTLLLGLILAVGLFIAAYNDFLCFEIPRESYLIPLICWLILTPFCGGELSLRNVLLTYAKGLLGGAGIAVSLLLISLILGRILKKDALGGGDLKLFFLAGLYLGFAENLLNLILTCIVGLLGFWIVGLFKEKSAYLPLAPAIAVSTIFTWLVGNSIVTWYLGLF